MESTLDISYAQLGAIAGVAYIVALIAGRLRS